ncbi:MAG: InlB B-repeat-containing protein, partial [Bacilli bacterium]|nr:InlB B-repeat-containing protein [Bacilli bacterium]
WYQDLDYLTPFASVDMPAANITAYAKWTPNERTITFNSNGGSAVATITNVYRTTISQPANPTREGYSFKGWYEDEGFTIPYRFVFIEDRDVTLYAKWEINQYNFIAYNDQAEMEFTTIAVGEEHMLALTGSSQIFAWGDNVYGQLGNNSTTSSSLPIDITKYFPLATGEGIIEIYAGNDFSAALTSDGRLFTWGYNGYGQLGLGTYTNYYSTPQDVTDMLLLADGETIDLVFVSRSAIHVVTSDGRVLGWGSSDMSGAYGIRRRPYDITPYFNFNPGETLVELSGGYQFIMAITSDDRIFGWGYDGYSGSFASGDYYYASAPVDFTSSFASILEPGESISDLEGADKVMFALTTSGRLLGWGYNQYGELLDGTTTKRSYPIDMTPSLSLDALEYIDHISAGWYHVSLLTSEGRMLTWGRNNFYQLGTMTTTDSMVPVDVTANMGVSDGDGIRQVVNTNYSSFVVTHNDHLIRFGNNQVGILGDGTTTTRSIPAQMSLVTWKCYELYRLEFADVLPTITDPGKYENTFDGWFENTGLTTPFTTTNMPAADFAIYAKWIPNQYSISFETNGGNAITAITLDYDSTINLPADPTKQGYTFAGWFTDAALSTPFTLPLMPEYDFTLYAGWTINVYNITYYYDLEPIQYIQVSNGGLHTIALTANGQVFTWGWNYYGQLGDGTTSSKQIPVDITANFYLNEGEKIINVYALYTHSVALTDSGRVFTWGYNTQGQLGDGTTTNRSLPVDITANFNFDSSETAVSIYRANQSVFVLTSLNKIFAFGSNSDGVLGYGDSINHVLPVEITGKFNLGTGETITMISGGLRHVMAISSTGRVFAWGYNSGNQFVFASTTPSGSLVPLDITNNLNLASGETITFIAAGNGQNYALTSLGKLLAWGYGKLGDGTTNYSATPINLMDYITLNPEESIIKIQAGNAYVLALSTDARLFSWGNNSAGQLGDGTTTERLLPVDVTNNFTFEVGENLSTLFTGYTASSSFVLSNIGGLYSFGLNNYGLLGDNTTTNRSVPTEINHIAFSYLITKQFDYQEAIVHIADPEKTGYTFAGWYTDTALTQAFTLTNMPSSHVKLYAKWQ